VCIPAAATGVAARTEVGARPASGRFWQRKSAMSNTAED